MKIIRTLHDEEVARYREGRIPDLLNRLVAKSVLREELTQIVRVRYQAAHFFEEWLRLIIRTVAKSDLDHNSRERLQFAASENLKEELGEVPEYGGPHKEGRITFLASLGQDPAEWETGLGTYDALGARVHVAARNLIESMRSMVIRGPIQAIAALWYYENRISLQDQLGDYYILLKAFESAFPEFKKDSYCEGDELWHIFSHAQHDTYHARLAEDALSEVDVPLKEQIIESTCREARVVIDLFWNEVLL